MRETAGRISYDDEEATGFVKLSKDLLERDPFFRMDVLSEIIYLLQAEYSRAHKEFYGSTIDYKEDDDVDSKTH